MLPLLAGLLVVSSLVTRAANFDAASASLPALSSKTHLGHGLTAGCAAWAESSLGLKWRTHVDARLRTVAAASANRYSSLAHDGANAVLLPAWARAGPACLGLALWPTFALAASAPASPRRATPISSRLMALFWSAQALATLAFVAVAPMDVWVGTDRERLVHAAAPLLAASSSAYLLFTASAAVGHPWRVAPTAAVLGWSGWRRLAARSYPILVLHSFVMARLAAAAAPKPADVGWRTVGELWAAGVALSWLLAEIGAAALGAGAPLVAGREKRNVPPVLGPGAAAEKKDS